MVLPILVAGIDKCCHESFDEEKPKINYSPALCWVFYWGRDFCGIFKGGNEFWFFWNFRLENQVLKNSLKSSWKNFKIERRLEFG